MGSCSFIVTEKKKQKERRRSYDWSNPTILIRHCKICESQVSRGGRRKALPSLYTQENNQNQNHSQLYVILQIIKNNK